MADAGWYPDPTGRNPHRYFGGFDWTGHVNGPRGQSVDDGVPPFTAQPMPGTKLGPPPPPTAPPPPPYGYPPMVPYGYPLQPVVAPKNPAVSLLVSFFIPGVGSMINGDVGIGVVILVGYIFSCILIIVLIGLILAPASWIWGLVDAYQGARRWNARHGIIS